MTMRRILIIGAIVICLLFGAVWLSALFNADTPEAPARVEFPVATSTGGVPVAGEPGHVTLRDGSLLEVRNFIGNGVTIKDPANEGVYYLAGSSGYCYEDGTCPTAGGEAPYSIVFFSEEGSVVIGLTREPLGEARRRAEEYLMETLGIGEEEMCVLNYYIGTTVHVNETYGSMGNLGFSFCPGAVKLP